MLLNCCMSYLELHLFQPHSLCRNKTIQYLLSLLFSKRFSELSKHLLPKFRRVQILAIYSYLDVLQM
jgi:hypothetical protein